MMESPQPRNRPGVKPIERVLFILIAAIVVLCIFLSVTLIQALFSPRPANGGSAPKPAASQPVAGVSSQTEPPPLVLPTWTPSAAPSLTPRKPSPGVDPAALLAQMSLEDKVGQMIMSGIQGQQVDETVETLVSQYRFGGFVYFGANVSTPAQTAQLSQSLQALAARNTPAVPLLIAIDHEGGTVFRFPNSVTHFPSAMAIGATHQPELAYQAASASAKELKALGINVILGPVLDINVNPLNPVIGLRAFGGTSELVSGMGQRYIAGLQENGMIAVAKHFPGHGDTNVDSHQGLPVINQPVDALLGRDLVPFQKAVDQQVAGVLVAHTANLSVDTDGFPATLSPKLNQQILRDRLGFQGVVFTDAMNMGAVVNNYGQDQAAVLAVLAGCDVLTFNDIFASQASWRAIMDAVKNGTISQERIDQSVLRILRLKAAFGLFQAQTPSINDVAWDADHQLAADIARKALTLRSSGAALPLVQTDRVLVISPDKIPLGSTLGDNLTLLGELLQARGLQVDEWIYPVESPNQTAALQAEVMGKITGYPLVIMLTYDARLRESRYQDTAQEDFLQAVVQSNVPGVFVAVMSPYDVTLVPQDRPALATYGALDVQIQALVEALFAKDPPPGTFPFSLQP